ncbi:hypothetical protein HOP50_02g10610 [Chloropicon primus]|uniref:Uncharacterized protein n=1 Tax=Chloropicon primus TaxID=1764295 RepID=A0A5B8MDT9_9CHLO|nr:hypothetical protein A3770_02p10750 [Chloropicon primus]UPQ97766.1 hypothetical protein HOP50_02g10610 [Chloropicon primus]|eukprot:QDZ18557.1 hypothetical protein A3770_02p10750 [Chloropicon primus]
MEGNLDKFEEEAARALGGGQVAKLAARKARAAENDKVVTVILKEVEDDEGEGGNEATREPVSEVQDASEIENAEPGQESEDQRPVQIKEFAVPSMFNVQSTSSGFSPDESWKEARARRAGRKGLAPSTFSFDTAHPAIASAHYLRTKEQDEILRQSIEESLLSPRSVKRRPKRKKKRRSLLSKSLGDLDLLRGEGDRDSERQRIGEKIDMMERDAEELSEAQESLTPNKRSSNEEGSTSRSAEEDWQTIQRLEAKILQLQSGIGVLKKSEDFKDFWNEVTVPASPEVTPSIDVSSRSVSFAAEFSEDRPSTSYSESPTKIVIPGIPGTTSDFEDSADEADTDVELPKSDPEAVTPDVKGKRKVSFGARPMSAPVSRATTVLSSEAFDSTGSSKRDEWKPIMTRPKPFSFLERDAERAKTKPISTVKMEQDLLIKEADEAGKKKANVFKAKKIPKSVLEARYNNMIKEQETLRMMKHEAHRNKQKEMMKPFAFDLVDKKRQEIKQKKIREAQEAKTKVKTFRANAVPASTYEPRYELLQVEKQRRASKVEERSRKLLAESKMPPRMEIGLNDFNPIPRAKASKVLKSPAKKVPSSNGQIPDYKKLHQEFEERLSQAKASNQLKRTIVKEFVLGGRTKEEAEANQKRMEKRLKSILQDIEMDANDQKELRWPYMSKRGKVRPTRPNFDKKCTFKVGDTLAFRLKAAEVQKAKERGQFDTKAEKEARKERHRAEEAKKRKKAWKKLNKMHKAAMALEFMGGDEFGAAFDETLSTSTKKTEKLDPDLTPPTVEDKSYSKTSAQHVIARHKQVAKRAAEIVEKALLAQGMDAYNFVKEPADML